MLKAAPATPAEVRARRLCASGAGRQKFDTFSRLPVAARLTRPHPDPITRHRQRNVEALSVMFGDAISPGTDAQDRDVEALAFAFRNRGLTGKPAPPGSAAPDRAAQPALLSRYSPGALNY
jgi:hypothetical protein